MDEGGGDHEEDEQQKDYVDQGGEVELDVVGCSSVSAPGHGLLLIVISGVILARLLGLGADGAVGSGDDGEFLLLVREGEAEHVRWAMALRL